MKSLACLHLCGYQWFRGIHENSWHRWTAADLWSYGHGLGPRNTLVELCGEKRVSLTWQESITWVTSSMVMEVSACLTRTMCVSHAKHKSKQFPNFWQQKCWVLGFWQCSLRPEPGIVQNYHLFYIYIMILYACACSAQHDLHESAICQNSTKEFN